MDSIGMKVTDYKGLVQKVVYKGCLQVKDKKAKRDRSAKPRQSPRLTSQPLYLWNANARGTISEVKVRVHLLTTHEWMDPSRYTCRINAQGTVGGKVRVHLLMNVRITAIIPCKSPMHRGTISEVKVRVHVDGSRP
jgi:hypothetical protein